ncbi:hypothetical protein PR202_ga31415 [Eleusine coracana subsp. coracana]|uniref:Protein kinase domain-containing protein n=1 Tax=Eleusine coracana subsp. coracana TaxID=191504 RepID=A0AAV5DRT5_ELECO|nr:hypothetical protein PR202_ga31415 [Eleusine coracana subsp. coracana]
MVALESLRRAGRMIRRSPPPLPHYAHQEDAAGAKDEEPPIDPHLGAMAGEKRGISGIEYELDALVAIKSAIASGKEEEGNGGAALLPEAALFAACRGIPAVVGFRAHRKQRRAGWRQLLTNVEAIGALGIVHGDIKPENVLVGNGTDGRTLFVICDFGLIGSAVSHPGHTAGLRARVPEDLLTRAGFDVLNGLLQIEPQDRLTPAAALQLPWFAEEDPRGILQDGASAVQYEGQADAGSGSTDAGCSGQISAGNAPNSV